MTMGREYRVWGEDADCPPVPLTDWTTNPFEAAGAQRHWAGIESDDHHPTVRRYDRVWVLARDVTLPYLWREDPSQT